MEPDGEIPESDLPYAEQRDYRVALVAAVVLALLLVALAVFLLTDDDDDEVTSGGTTTTLDAGSTSTTGGSTTSEASTSSSASSSSTSSQPAGGGVTDEEAATIAWPEPSGSTTFTTPDDAAASFATDLVGFTDPVVGDFQAGDARSGEIEVRAIASGPATTVLVRQMSDDNWYVLGAVTPEIQVENPLAGTAIDHPLQVAGQASAFEGTVDVAVYERGNPQPLGTGFVTGSGGGAPGPFTGEVSWDNPGGGWGLVVFSVASAEDGSIWQAAVVPVGFIGGD